MFIKGIHLQGELVLQRKKILYSYMKDKMIPDILGILALIFILKLDRPDNLGSYLYYAKIFSLNSYLN